MKDFLKTLIAVVCGLLLFGFIVFFIMFGALGAALNSSSSKPTLPRSGVLAVDMSEFVLSEQSTEQLPSLGFGGMEQIPNVGIFQAVSALKTAADDPGVKFIFLKTDGNLSGVASLEEFRKALQDFRATGGKPVVAYMESPTTGSYWLASVADKVYMSSYQGSNYNINGVSVQSTFIKDLLDKLGVNVQLIRHGKYKSAGEMFIRKDSSPENTLQTRAMVDAIWATLRKDICTSRSIPEQALDEAIDGLKLCLPEDFLHEHLADALVTREELKERLTTLSVEEDFDDVKFIPFADYVAAKVSPNLKSRDKIAVLYADGEIVDGKDPRGVAGDSFAAVIDEIRKDDAVKAVVFRVNSPGGSVLASEKIKHEIDLLSQEKPVVASYGGYAASGGYWISNGCEKIFSDATTLTGSIGVFGMVPDLGKLTKDKIGVNFQSVSSNRHGDMFSLMRPLDPSEYAYMQRSIESVYDKFITLVAEGRDMDKKAVDEIAQGRVWAGTDAKGIALVDEIGTLQDALEYAASLAGNAELADWQITEFPPVLSPMEELMLSLGDKGEHQYVLNRIEKMKKPQVVARMPYQMVIQ